ncbi:MAG TPA: pyruvate:ferredoxin (flavodoxin) oxidoreductase [Bdellovibrionota bacterium]|nr:pyruvate:ferredoxin (flavodoxin) oxidoreductase [Bdellovibrionota bacterium]
MLDANEAVGSIAYRTNEVIAIYPITPSSPMGEWADEWAAKGMKNIFGDVPEVVEMQSEGGVAGAVHGALQTGALTTTFTASQGLLLMIPNLYKIAGELTPFTLHVAARTVATHALSIFGDHSDVMACRPTGFAFLCSNSVQEAQDLALIAQMASLESRIPFLHFFDGFRTSHEIAKIEPLSDDDLKALTDPKRISEFRNRSLTPDRPVIRGTAQNPDAFFQAREACNPWYSNCASVVQQMMDRFGERSGRRYRLFDYVGHPQAERVIVMMGSGAETALEVVEERAGRGEKVGLVCVRLYRPFDVGALCRALPASVKSIAVLDRTKEPGGPGEPLYLDVVCALHETRADGSSEKAFPRIVAGRYGLSSKEFTPAMVKAVFSNLKQAVPKNRFTVGINDDVSRTSLPFESAPEPRREGVTEALFFGLGSDGTVGANKNSIKIIGEGTDLYAQGYFVYDSKKAGAMTASHLRFGKKPIHSTYQIQEADFVACHQFNFLEKLEILEFARAGATVLLNAPYPIDRVWEHLPKEAQEAIVQKKLRVYSIEADKIALEAGIKGRVNTIMQVCFFALSSVLSKDEAIAAIKGAIQKTYAKRGPDVVRQNIEAVDQTLAHLHELPVPASPKWSAPRLPMVAGEAPDLVQRVTALMMANKGDLLPVSAFPPDGTWPTGTSRWEKRNLASEIPAWDPSICIQCNKCALICPHAAIRAKVYSPGDLAQAPPTFKSNEFKSHDLPGMKYTIQVAPEDCTGCTLCVMVCPAKDKSNPKHKAIDMVPQRPIRETEIANYAFFLQVREADRTKIKADVKGSQFLQPLFEYSGACAGCGETPYLKLLTQLFGDRLMIANATGCSSIYGGNLPTTPYSKNREGRGPVWSNSLFEDNAEFGFGYRLGQDAKVRMVRRLVETLQPDLGDEFVRQLLDSPQTTEEEISAQRKRVEDLKGRLRKNSRPEAPQLLELADELVRKSIWIVGGDGWAYDIGFGGLDHVLAMGKNVNLLVLDTEVYSNTGGQQSKSTPMGAAAKFAMAGRELPKKDLGMMAMTYGHIYVARVALGAKDAQTVRAFMEAESYDGPSMIIAYSHCIAHGYNMAYGPAQQKLAVDSGIWPLYRFDPRRVAENQPPLQLDSPPPKSRPIDYMQGETRFRMAEKIDPKRFQRLMQKAVRQAADRWSIYEQLAGLRIPRDDGKDGTGNGSRG